MVSITIETDNAASRDAGDGSPGEGLEVARILRLLAEQVGNVSDLTAYSAALVDLNGQTVGRIEVE